MYAAQKTIESPSGIETSSLSAGDVQDTRVDGNACSKTDREGAGRRIIEIGPFRTSPMCIHPLRNAQNDLQAACRQV